MKRIACKSLISVLLLTSGLFTSVLRAGTQGTFRGEVVSAPRGEQSAGLLYLRGRDGNVRRVVVARAAIVYDAQVPSGDRIQSARRALVPGTEVRVTALVDAKSGEWTASRVEVIAHHAAEFEDDYGEDGTAPDEPEKVTAPSENAIASRTI
jgi:hypothetical protein